MVQHIGKWIGGNRLLSEGDFGLGRRGPSKRLARILDWVPWGGFIVAVSGLLMVVLSGFGYRWEWWELRSGAFTMLQWGAVFALIGAGLCLIGVIVAWPGRGHYGFAPAMAGLMLGAIAFLIPYHQWQVVRAMPFIHDITTDTQNPPVFVVLAEVKAGTENGVDYGGQTIAEQQQAAYPDVVTLEFAASPEIVFGEAVTVAKNMGWKIAQVAPSDGRIEATATTFWFGFKDDVVIRVAADAASSTHAAVEADAEVSGDDAAVSDIAEGSEPAVVDSTAKTTRVDIRSMSRVGTSDVGVNARRIRNFSRSLTELVIAAP